MRHTKNSEKADRRRAGTPPQSVALFRFHSCSPEYALSALRSKSSVCRHSIFLRNGETNMYPTYSNRVMVAFALLVVTAFAAAAINYHLTNTYKFGAAPGE